MAGDAPSLNVHRHGKRVHGVARMPNAVPRWARGSRAVRRLRDYVSRWELPWREQEAPRG